MVWLLVGLALADTCSGYASPEVTGEVSGGPSESSGVAAGWLRPDVLYTHDDSGGEPVIYAFGKGGALLGEHLVKNADNEDWEDIDAAPCPDKGECLYIADIGDNGGDRPNITIYVVREPSEKDTKIKAIERWVAVYPDGAHDAETLLVHPCTGGLFVVTKEDDGNSDIYRFPAELTNDTMTLEKVATVIVEGSTATARRISGGSWDVDGDRLALRTGNQVLEWVTDPSQPNAHWADPPVVLGGANELQGEAITYTLGGDLVTTSEGSPMQVAVFACEELASADHACDFPQTGGCGCSTGGGHPWMWMLGLAGLARRRR